MFSETFLEFSKNKHNFFENFRFSAIGTIQYKCICLKTTSESEERCILTYELPIGNVKYIFPKINAITGEPSFNIY